MSTFSIKGVPITFPYEPYEIQKTYMEKVICCLQNEQNGVLESPTGTGKTLCLLCASLAWLDVKKAQIQAQMLMYANNLENRFANNLKSELDSHCGTSDADHKSLDNVRRNFGQTPKIIYASRTHSQLTQAVREMKKTSYKHLKACVLGSREQTCIHPDIMNEPSSSIKMHLCQLKVKSRSCQFYNRTETMTKLPEIDNARVVDIEDVVQLGQKHRFCPYYMTKELKQNADIIFMPYNYLLDPKARKALGVELANNIIILDEAHNVEKVCEESASIQIKSTDMALCIEEITGVMKALNEDAANFLMDDLARDFSPEDLCYLKERLLSFEKVIDEIPIEKAGITTFDGDYIYNLFEKAEIGVENYRKIENLLDKLVQFLVTTNDGPFQRKGTGLQLFHDLILITFAGVSEDFREKVKKCYKVHIEIQANSKKRQADNWLSRAAASKDICRVLSFWCFSPGFGMNMLIRHEVHSIILTSGTLAPLKPLISELELNVDVRLENPHVVKGDQICVKIVTKGPDGEVLNCNYHNRDNPKYIASIGSTILNLTRIIPEGLLIFFPSYPILQNCQQVWQQSGLWSNINDQKAIYVEPREKNAFNTAMSEYYSKIQNTKLKGAIFMGVCRGKVSEGLDFADMNGRGVVIIGLPYPPMKDPKVILKKRYLDACNSIDKEFLKGDDWYGLEATRAVNQAIGRVIRHRFDYGAIILLDSRFSSYRVKSQLSLWLQNHLKIINNFGEIVRDLRIFFKNAKENFAIQPKINESINNLSNTTENINIPNYSNLKQEPRKGNFDFSSSSILISDDSSSSSEFGSVSIHKRSSANDLLSRNKKIKYNLLPNSSTNRESISSETSIKEFIAMVKKALDVNAFKLFVAAIAAYKTTSCLDDLKSSLDDIFLNRKHLRYIVQGLAVYINDKQKEEFDDYFRKMY